MNKLFIILIYYFYSILYGEEKSQVLPLLNLEKIKTKF